MATIPASEPHSVAGVHSDSILLAEVLLDLAERAQAYTNAAGVAIALIRGKDLLVRTSTGTAPEVGTTIPLADAFISECVRSRKPLACRDIEADSRVGPALRDLKVRSVMAIPVCEVRDVRGMMLVIAPLPNSFQPTHISILMTLSDIIAAKLREHETAAEVEIHLFDDSEQVPEFPAEPPASPIDCMMSFDDEPASAQPDMAMAAAPTPVPSIFDPTPGSSIFDTTPSVFDPPVVTAPALSIFDDLAAPPAAAVAPPVSATPTSVEVVPAPSPVAVKPPLFKAPVPPMFETPATPPPSPVKVELPVVAPPAPAVAKPPVVAPPAPIVAPPGPPVVASSVIGPPASFPVKAPLPPAPATVKPPVQPPAPPAVPSLGSPALPMTPTLAMMEEKIELAERAPGLLTPSKDPLRFKRNRTFVGTTIKPSVPTTSTTTVPKASPVTPFVVVEPAKPTPLEPANLATPAPAIVSMPAPALTSWETPPEEKAKSAGWVAVAAIAAVLVIAIGFWMNYAANKPVPAPVIPVPGRAATALPAVAPVPPVSAATSEPAAKAATESAKTTKPAETQAAPEPKREASHPVIEIAAGQAKPKELELDVPAPKLDLPSRDPSIGNLSRIPVTIPVAPKSDLVPASLIARVNPAYPQMAKQLGTTGTVVMSVTIAKNGSVSAVHVTAGALQLRAAAMEAVKKWRYKPASLNGQPIESSAEVRVNFTR